MSEITISPVLGNILVICTRIVMLAWAAAGIGMFISTRAEIKYDREKNKRDLEYHEARMKEYLDK
nr:MAG TPA: hypothetical protein [Caudoviricetes sp.]